MGRIVCKIYPSTSTVTYPTIIITGYDRIYAATTVRVRFANLQSLPAGVTDSCSLGVSLTYFTYGGTKGYIYEPVSFVVGPTTAFITPKAITLSVAELSTNYVGELANYTFSGSIDAAASSVTTSDYILLQFPTNTFEGVYNLNFQALCSLASSSKCNVFGRANQIYIQPSSTLSPGAFSFTVQNILNAAYQISYQNITIKMSTIVSGKVNAYG